MNKLEKILSLGVLGAFLFSSGCQKQIFKINVDDPEKTIIQIDSGKPNEYTEKEFRIPAGSDFTLTVDHPEGVDSYELDGSFDYILVREKDELVLYQSIHKRNLTAQQIILMRQIDNSKIFRRTQNFNRMGYR